MSMQIGEVASRTGLSVRTVRYYDEVGLVSPSARSAGGFRLYTTTDVERIELIKALRALDLPMEQMKELLSAVDTIDTSSAFATGELTRLAFFRGLAQERVTTMRAQITGLEHVIRRIRRIESQAARSADHRAAGA